jgi:uncharacterized protein (TIGR03437 family)
MLSRLPTLPLIVAFFAAIAQAQTGYLTYQTGANPNGIAVADLNGDGKSDLVVATLTSLTVLLNNGSGSFHSPATITLTGAAATIAPRTVVAADLNRDHKIDLVVAGYHGLATLLGNGDGTFQPAQLVSPAVADVQVGDLNGDGIPDLAVTFLFGGFLIPTGASLSILPGKGDGTFGDATTFNLLFTPWAASAIADLNGDGKPDIAVAVGQGLVVFLNDGHGGFQAQATNQPWNFAPGIIAADFNADGILDLAVSGQSVAQDGTSNGQGILTILLGRGDGTFRTLPSVITPTVSQTISAADVNGDGHVDLIVGLIPPAYFAGLGDGTFATGISIGALGGSGYVALGNFSGSGMGLASAGGYVPDVVILPRIVFPSLSLQNLSAAAFGLGPLAPGSIAAAFGSHLAAQTAATSNVSLPLTLGGDSVTVTASDGRVLPAQLYYVSPAQVNYLIPKGAAPGLATVTINSNGSVAATGQIDIEIVAPQLFTLNPANLVAANVIRVSASSQQTILPVYMFDSNGNLAPLPIELSSATDSVYLSIYGTGISNVTDPNGVIASIGGLNAQVVYAGPQGDYPGLDQVNILLPKSLASPTPYTAALQLTVGGQPSNQVKVGIQ